MVSRSSQSICWIKAQTTPSRMAPGSHATRGSHSKTWRTFEFSPSFCHVTLFYVVNWFPFVRCGPRGREKEGCNVEQKFHGHVTVLDFKAWFGTVAASFQRYIAALPMEKYSILRPVGRGTFGSAMLVEDKADKVWRVERLRIPSPCAHGMPLALAATVCHETNRCKGHVR